MLNLVISRFGGGFTHDRCADADRLQQQALDFVFARLGGDPTAPPPSQEADEEAEPVPVPVVKSADDLRAASEWLARERQRLQAYTRTQLARIQEERQGLAQQQYLNEQTLIFRSQELARREEMLLAQGRSLQQQAEELAQREQSLAAQLHQWWQAHEELAGLEEATRSAREDVARHNALLEALRSETEAAQRARADARTEAGSIQAAAEELRDSRLREEASLKARQEQLEQRLLTADRTAWPPPSSRPNSTTSRPGSAARSSSRSATLPGNVRPWKNGRNSSAATVWNWPPSVTSWPIARRRSGVRRRRPSEKSNCKSGSARPNWCMRNWISAMRTFAAAPKRSSNWSNNFSKRGSCVWINPRIKAAPDGQRSQALSAAARGSTGWGK